MDTYEVDSVEWGSAAVTISNAADSIDSFVARLSASAASSTSSTRETCAQIIICVNQVREVFRAAATARKVRVLRWLGKQAEELDAVAKAWDACARVCALESAEVAMEVFSPLLYCASDPLLRLSCYTALPFNSFDDPITTLSTLLRVQGSAPLTARVQSLSEVPPPAGASVDAVYIAGRFLVLDETGDEVAVAGHADSILLQVLSEDRVRLDRISCRVTVEGASTVDVQCVFPNVLPATSVVIELTLHGTTLSSSILPVGRIEGTYDSVIALQESSNNSGIAINSSGSLLAVTNASSDTISIYQLPDGAYIRTICGRGEEPGKLRLPRKIRFVPTSDNLLVVEENKKAVQELSVTGDHIRFLAGDFLTVVSATGLDIHCGIVYIARCSREGPVIGRFRYEDGAALPSLPFPFPNRQGEETFPRFISGFPESLCLSPDGTNVLVAYPDAKSVFLYSAVSGELLSTLPHRFNSPFDACFAGNGDIIVLESGGYRVSIVSSDGSTVRTSFGENGAAPGQFRFPIAGTVHNRKLYVLDHNSKRVQIFR